MKYGDSYISKGFSSIKTMYAGRGSIFNKFKHDVIESINEYMYHHIDDYIITSNLYESIVFSTMTYALRKKE